MSTAERSDRVTLSSNPLYPLDLQWVMARLSPGAALGVALTFEGVRPGRLESIDWADIDGRGFHLSVGPSTEIYLSRTARGLLGPRRHDTGPVVSEWNGEAISRRKLLKDLKAACKSAQVGPWTLHDIHRRGERHRNLTRPPGYGSSIDPARMGASLPTPRPRYRRQTIGFLPHPHDGIDIALQVRRVRPGLQETVKDWVERLSYTGPGTFDARVADRAASYAIAAGLPPEPTLGVLAESIVHLAAMWAIDDILSLEQAEVFATLIRDNAPLDQAAGLAKLLAPTVMAYAAETTTSRLSP